ncbi:hypothetical protein Scep_012208 [Stephania cephalantha]|uniref:Uncharacterized protein n=1 Tax=Stephania cephalantha TaxID=152367 RepID=A0AAP0JFK5_9MAGN
MNKKNRWVLHPSEFCARRMTKIFKRGMITEGYCWKLVLDHQKEIYWERWKDPSIDEAIVRAAYDAKACVRVGSEKALHNRKSEKGGPGIGPSKHTGGTRSFQTYEDILALDKDEDDEVTPNDVFLHVHTKDHDGLTFIDSISAQFHAKLVRRREEHPQATPDQPIDEEQLYYDAAGVCPKGPVYGLESLARKTRRYADPGASTSQEPMVRRSEFDAVVQRLARFEVFMQSQLGMRMDFGANTFQAPPPHHHRHHLRSIISRLEWIRLVHHSSSTTMTIETTRIGWTRSTLHPKESFEGGAGRWRGPTARFIA